jgi:membrane-bound lytic murein transglycosylase B
MIRFLLPLLLLTSSVHAASPYATRSDVLAFVDDMVARHGLERTELMRDFAQVTPSPAVIKAIQPPTDNRQRSWAAYRARFVEPTRIARGMAFRSQHQQSLARAEAEFGVPAEIIVAIIGVETLYGRDTGRFHIFNALSNLAFDYPPRAELFRRELEELLLMARENGRQPWSYRGSYAGAIGLPQFLPSSLRRYAVDFDGNGRIELEQSREDSIGSVASFLAQHGWQTGTPILAPATDGADTAVPESAVLLELATPDGANDYRLAYANFHVLTRYNRSRFYAAAVADLAQALAGAR